MPLTALPRLSPLTFGTGGVTDPGNPAHVAAVRAAMDAGIWFHCADYGGGVYAVLKRAFAEDPAHVPPCIFKVDGTSVEGFRASVRDALARTGVPRIDIGQVCGNPVGEEMAPLAEAMAGAAEQGQVGGYIMDVIPAYSPKVMRAVEEDLFAGYIFYYNVMECGVSRQLRDLLASRRIPVLAMRTFGGRDGGNFLTDLEHPRRRALLPIYARARCGSPVEFCVRFPLSHPHVHTTVGSTGRVAHLCEFLASGHARRPLDPELVRAVDALHWT